MAKRFWRTPFDYPEKATKPARVLIDKDRCKGCSYCVEFCPRQALRTSDELSPKGYTLVEVVDENRCLGCGLCTILCPEFAIHINLTNQES